MSRRKKKEKLENYNEGHLLMVLFFIKEGLLENNYDFFTSIFGQEMRLLIHFPALRAYFSS